MPDASDQLRAIDELLDERLGHDNDDGSESTVERVADLITAFESWTDLAIHRLHQIHRLKGEECPVCEKYPGER